MTLVDEAEQVPDSPLWSVRYLLTTAGILLLITIAAFEAMGVNTAMPRLIADLHGEALYSWPFTTFVAASLVGTVISGRLCDRYGPPPALLVGPPLFLAGLLVSGTAHGMAMLLAGRALQGVGGGVQIVGVYVLIAVVYPERLRPAAFGLLAAAWVVPSVVGPTVAGLVAEHLGWRWVFLGLAPLALLGVALLVRTTRNLPPHPGATARARRGLPLAALAAAVGVSALTWAAQHPSAGMLPLGLGGLVLLVPALRVLLPAGTLLARRGLARVVLARGLLAGAFFAVEAFVPLTLTTVHHYPLALAGLPLTVGALGWSAASWWQGRHPELARTTLIRWAFALQAMGLAGTALIAFAWWPGWLVTLTWIVGASGMGLAWPSISVLALAGSPAGERGFTSSALQVADMFLSATLVGLGGVLLTALASATHPGAAVFPLDLAMAGVALLGFALFSVENPASAPSGE